MTPIPWAKSGIPARTARDHLRKLRKMGVPQAALAAASGYSERRMASIMSGQTKHLKRETHEAIMAIGLSAIQGAEKGKISSEESKRLIAEILAAGYSQGWICRQTGRTKNNNLMLSNTINAARAKRIKDLHDRLWLENEVGWRVKCGNGKPIYGLPMREACRCYDRLTECRERSANTEAQRRCRLRAAT